MKKVLLGNKAIVEGALGAGVDFISGYPGCPSAEIGEEFIKIGKENNIYAEWSSNEKTALEAAIGASFSGLKSLVNMKSFGINVCSDVLLPLAYTGTRSPMVIVVADDPSCHSSAQSEQDSRGYAFISNIPVLDPADPQECYDFTKLGFEISEKFNTPVILRTTTRAAHQRAIVEFQNVDPVTSTGLRKIGNFSKNPHQFLTMPPRVLEMKKDLLEKIKKISAFAEKSKANAILGNKKSKIGIIATGVSLMHAKEALLELDLDVPVLKLGIFYPLPEKMIANFLKGKTKILVAEEMTPYLEKEIARIACLPAGRQKVRVFGKDVLPEVGELNTELICIALAKITGKKYLPAGRQVKNLMDLPRRTARLCEGCPYWNILPVVKRVAEGLPAGRQGTIFGGDIGCNMIGALPPHNMYDYMFCMGSSIGIAHGIKKSTNQKVISFMGDGTFFHSGIEGLINAVYNKSNPLMIVMDNRITAMTGHQPNPGQELKIEEVARACGVKNIKTLDPANIKEFEEAIKDFLEKKEVSVIICKHICALLEKRLKK